MRIWYLVMAILVMCSQLAHSEIWDFSCTEAVSLLRAAQERVVRKHDQLQEAKFSVRHVPKVFDGCRQSRRGFQGGEIYCVTHQSKHGNLLKDILVAQRSLDVSIQEFQKYQKGVLLACATSLP